VSLLLALKFPLSILHLLLYCIIPSAVSVVNSQSYSNYLINILLTYSAIGRLDVLFKISKLLVHPSNPVGQSLVLARPSDVQCALLLQQGYVMLYSGRSDCH
jgi:hypothetical protein